MTVQEIIDEIDLAGFDDLDVADKVNYINRAVRFITNSHPWAFREVQDTLTQTAVNQSTGEVTLTGLTKPNGGIMEIINTSSGGGSALQWVRRDQHLKENVSALTTAGTPTRYFFIANRLFLYPIPSTITFKITYLAHQPTLVQGSAESAILIPSDHHEIIVFATLYRLNAREDDPENAAMFKSMFDESMDTMRQDLEKVQWDSPDTVQYFGWDDSDF